MACKPPAGPILWRILPILVLALAAVSSGAVCAEVTPGTPPDHAMVESAVSPGQAATGNSASWRPEIHCKHFFHGYPWGTPATNDLIIRDIYAMSSNDETKFADWVAYRLDRATVDGTAKTSRNWEADPWLDEEETLEPEDYRDAHAQLQVDRGHQAPLGSFRGTPNWDQTNFLSNITPQRSDLNQGGWNNLEQRVRDLALANTVFVMTGPLFERAMPALPGADESHRVPSGYWKIVCVVEGDGPGFRAAAFLFDQETPRNSPILGHLATIDEIEIRSGLDFLWELPDDLEERIESQTDQEWARTHFPG